MSDKKVKQVVVNVSDESKAQITELKAKLNVTDKEFISALLIVLGGTDEAVVKSAVETVTIEKQKAKIEARIVKLEAEIAKAKASGVEVAAVEPVADEVAA